MATMILRVAGAFLFSFLSLAQDAPKPAPSTPPSKDEIEKIVRDYIVQHPEVLIESLRLYQERERQAALERGKAAIKQHQSDLFNDPSAPAAGKQGDAVSLVMFFDYRCGYCKQVDPTLMQLLAEAPNARIVFKEFPILSPDSLLAAKASLAANRQGFYLPFHQALMASSGSITLDTISQTAAKIGLNFDKLKADMESPEILKTIKANLELANQLKIESTPTFIIGSELVVGTKDLATFKALLAKAEAERKKSPTP